MSIAEAMRSQLSASVGNTQTNREDDVRHVKDRLNRLGRFEEKPDQKNGFITRDLDTAIKGFQRDMGLKVDGVIKPKGETERMMTQMEQRRPTPTSFPPLGSTVGNNKANEAGDVQTVQTLLSLAGLLPKVKEVLPSGILDASDITAIKDFQKQNRLKVDGTLTPKGETETALKKAAKPEGQEPKTLPKPQKKPNNREDQNSTENNAPVNQKCEMLRERMNMLQSQATIIREDMAKIEAEITNLEQETRKAFRRFGEIAAEYQASRVPLRKNKTRHNFNELIDTIIGNDTPNAQDQKNAWQEYQATKANNDTSIKTQQKKLTQAGRKMRELQKVIEKISLEYSQMECRKHT